MSLSVRRADPATLRLLDSAAVAWLVLWVTLGAWTGWTLWQVSDLGDTVTTSGRAIASAGEALTAVANVPVIGEKPGEVGAQTLEAGREIAQRGQVVKGQLRQLGVLLGLSIAFIPVTPILGLYVPLRIARRREVRRVQRAVSQGRTSDVDRLLADRARLSLPFDRMVEVRTSATDEADEDRLLADAELRRLGLTPARG